ncbi:hypothetical protein L208DRAFT_888514 [Tricholoma matsutake]|nr:hypothetical protein L208DRAFT_888514 [Tricholoma matsutake 945]
MPPYSFSNIRNSSFNCMEGTSSNSLPPYLPNSIPASSTTIKQSEFELPSEETWSSLILPSSLISKSSGSMSPVPLEQHSPSLLNSDSNKCTMGPAE